MNALMDVESAATDSGFDTLYRTYQRSVYRHCFRMLRNQADAEDLTQEVFLRVFRKLSTFRGESRFSTWLHRLTINTVLMQLRGQRRRPAIAGSLGGSPNAEVETAVMPEVVRVFQASLTSMIDRVTLDRALARLSPGYRKVLVLHDVQGFGHEEIARLLAITAGTSKSQLHKARHRLRLLLHNGRGKRPCPGAALPLRRSTTKRKGLSRNLQFAAA